MPFISRNTQLKDASFKRADQLEPSESETLEVEKTLFPIMLEIAGFIGSMVGIFLSMYYIPKKGLASALDIGTFWIVESLCLPLAFAGFFFEDAFQDGKKYSICTKESSYIFISFGLSMAILHYGKSGLESKMAIILTFLIYLFISSLSLLNEMVSKKATTRYGVTHIALCFCVILYCVYFAFRFLI
ncbi:MAG: hypothetical protein EBU93_03965 [Chlamydiae bacterium]|jgi:hypothetical protein|nr:hypothetical protein [Chlamydiota bacterium]